MLLRRVIEHVRAQNWTAVVIDFVIVVVGVFVGLQAQQWAENQADRKRESEYLLALAKDIREDIAHIEKALNVERARMSTLDHLLREATGAALPDGFNSARGRVIVEPFPPYAEDDPYDTAYTLFIYDSMIAHKAAYETIINTGGLELIRDAALLREIQDYYASVELIDRFEELMEAARDRFIEAQRQAGISPVDRRSMKELVEFFEADAAMTAAGKNFWLFTNRHLMYLTELKFAADTVARMLETEVK